VLDTIRAKRPRLVIIDLDSVKMRPLDALDARSRLRGESLKAA